MAQTERYRIQNRITQEWFDTEAESAQEACAQAGWLIGDCWVREQTHNPYVGWRNVTFWGRDEERRRP